MALNYNAPIAGQKSSIDGPGSDQMQSFLWLRKAIIEARKEQYFFPLANVKNMPKHYGKTIRVFEYVPLLDDRNINDQGIDANGVTIADGNLYGSSKDIGTIKGKLPVLSENGGRVNRVGFKRLTLEGEISEFGMFTEFTKDSIEFDSDDQLREHLSRELMNGAVQIQEAQLQIDLLSNAGVELFAGAATADDEITGEGPTPSLISHADIMRLDQILTENRTPRNTTIISGSRFTDTRVIPASRIMYVGSELVPHLKTLKDSFGNKAFIEVQHYADAGNLLNGEIGSIDAFRVIQVPEMLHWAGAGAVETNANPGFRATDGRYDVYPMLVVGDDSFTALGFQNDGKKLGINVMTRNYGKEAMDYNDPYGKIGISSLTWYYGMLVYRPERIAVAKTVAPL
ncbi:major capsid protein [Pseudomonas phage ZC03]|uniref:Major capsid protein n=2 Tax=Zicotriavirus TaxID=2843161 RepID=A0A1L2C927_9CAUD|nr:major head protein [Pseudomonas phage ZC03]YP_009830592.1 major head protein [Pseudomonas phage ZC08]AMD43408.1 major capsid protein [Pseudomonas phage ZC03]AMD43535.1 major capsid protein [Pseudomonas phage ZC08]